MGEKKLLQQFVGDCLKFKQKVAGRAKPRPAVAEPSPRASTSTTTPAHVVDSISLTGSVPPSRVSHSRTTVSRPPPSKEHLYQLAYNGRDNEYAIQILRDFRHSDEFWEVIHTCVLTGAQGANVSFMEELLALGASMGTSIRSGTRDTALHVAARAGQRDMVKWLLAHGGDPWAVNDDGHTAKDVAEAMNYRGCARSLGLAMPSTRVAERGWWDDVGDTARDRTGAYDRRLPGGGSGSTPMRQRPFYSSPGNV